MTVAPIHELGVLWRGAYESVLLKVRHEWNPEGCDNEAECRDSLLAFLRSVVPADVVVEKEYAHEGGRIDVFLQWPRLLSTARIYFELKFDLRDASEYDRLIGQLDRTGVGENDVVLVLCGATDRRFVARLRQKFATLLNPLTPLMEMTTASFAIVEKPSQ